MISEAFDKSVKVFRLNNLSVTGYGEGIHSFID
jgi:hypothetical protein